MKPTLNYIFELFVIKIILLVTILGVSSSGLFAEGTRQVSPTYSANGAALFVYPLNSNGSYTGCPASQRIQFTIANATTENLYFGFHPRTFDDNSTSIATNAYYRIFNSSGATVAGPTLIPSNTGAGFISAYNQAVAGPNIGGQTPSGYAPFVFDPAVTGDYYIELYRSNGDPITFPFFDFTVATATNIQYPGRVWCKKWSFITCEINNANFPDIYTSSFTGSFYGYTADHFILKTQFTSGFRPLGFEISMNYEGVQNTGDFAQDRASVNTNTSVPEIVNPYQIFLNSPDTNVFPTGTYGNTFFTSNIYGCTGAYFIPYFISEAGDLSILLDINGTAGYQAGTSDVVLEAFGLSAGNHVMQWDGLNGLGNLVSSGANAQVTAVLHQGRTNIPIYDAEVNPNGFSVISIFPSTGSQKLYWDDSNLTTFGSCNDNLGNITTGGIDNSALYSGSVGPSHAWNGSNPTKTVPAVPNGGGNTTEQLCDDYGNSRMINTWFYALQSSSASTSMVFPSCDKDSDGINDDVDLDADNDGISNIAEHSGLTDPLADADTDGIPNYIDPSFSGFVDSNHDGVDDRYDIDQDGVINMFDLDSDNDGIFDVKEAGGIDDNNNGIVDNFVDLNVNGLTDQWDTTCNGSSSNRIIYGYSVYATSGTVTNPNNAVDANIETYAILDNTADDGIIVIELQHTLPSGTVVSVRTARYGNNNGSVNVSQSINGSTFSNQIQFNTANTPVNNSYTLNSSSKYIKVARDSRDARVYEISYTYTTTPCSGGVAIPNPNTDGAGLTNVYDSDSDGDGCPDVREAGFTDANSDGKLDGSGVSSTGKVTGNANGYTSPNNNYKTAGTAPSITSQPASSVSICNGGNGSIVAAVSNATIYQWQVNTGSGWINITSAGSNPIYSGYNTSSTLGISGAVMGNKGYQYRLLVSSSTYACQTISNTSTLTVNALPATPTISAGGPTTLCAGGSVLLTSSSATGNQWYMDGSPISGGTNQTYIATTAGSYNVIVTTMGCPSAASATTSVSVNALTAITNQSTSTQTQCVGGSFNPISVTTTGVGLNYQWYSNTSAVNSGGNPLGAANGAQTNTYTPQTAIDGTLYYYCIVTGTCGTATSAISGEFVVRPIPTINYTVSGSTTVCQNTPGPVITFSNPQNLAVIVTFKVVGIANDYTIVVGANSTAPISVPTNNAAVFVGSNIRVAYETGPPCSNLIAGEITITVTATPLAPTGPGTQVYCSSQGKLVSDLTSILTGTDIIWYDAATLGNVIAGTSTLTTRNYYASQTVSGCQSTSRKAVAVTVNPTPIPSFIAPPGIDACAEDNVVYTTQSSKLNYVWNVPGTPGADYTIISGGIGASNHTVTLKWLTAGSKKVTVNYTDKGCPGTAAASTIIVHPLPTIGSFN